MTKPYLWRYRERDIDAGQIDMLLLPIGGEGILGGTGETTIVWWGRDDDG